MVARSTPILGPALDEIIAPGQIWYAQPGRNAAGTNQGDTPDTGTTAFGTDGRIYIWVKASAAIASAAAPGTQLALTRTGEDVTAAAGSGGYYPAKPATAIAEGSLFWAVKGTTTA